MIGVVRRRVMGAKAVAYSAEIAYLESTSRSYINTGIIPELNCNIECRFRFVTILAGRLLFGAKGSNNVGRLEAYNWTGLEVNHNHSQVFLTGIAANTFYTLRKTANYYAIYDDNNNLIADTTVANVVGNCPVQLYLFALNRNNVVNYDKTSQITSFKLWNTSNDLLIDLIPWRVGTTGYMYDRVSGNYFGNDGTTDFICGPDV